MYISKTDAERYGYETYAEKAESKWTYPMLGFVAAFSLILSVVVYFSWSVRILMTEVLFTTTSIAFFVLVSYSVQQLAETY